MYLKAYASAADPYLGKWAGGVSVLLFGLGGHSWCLVTVKISKISFFGNWNYFLECSVFITFIVFMRLLFEAVDVRGRF